ncbi:MAG: hypothetical protein WDA75_21800 [Candidatus Latescibacterota bacterium]|jgi:hypothetical protein
MVDLKEQYIIDSTGKRVAAIIPIEEFERLQDLLAAQDDAGPSAPDSDDVTTAITEGQTDVRAGKAVPLAELLNALRG